ncbi:hypothetical protein [Ruegeria atlantica]|uniref:hypothetical protein n=1 Tax=Ruegeria atlantica TaxID=81569 RepID=UPI0011AE8671|nr:hypothetical protein [Ruegeria atlantica]
MRRLDGPEQIWFLPDGEKLSFPVALDIQSVAPGSREVDWRIDAHMTLQNRVPIMAALHITNPSGIDPAHMKAFFRWETPLDVVRILVPDLLRRGVDPFDYNYPTRGFPDAAIQSRHPLSALTDDFLREIADQYRAIGRGYSAKIAAEFGVSKRTAVSWVEKARKKGILGKTRPGKYGEDV